MEFVEKSDDDNRKSIYCVQNKGQHWTLAQNKNFGDIISVASFSQKRGNLHVEWKFHDLFYLLDFT